MNREVADAVRRAAMRVKSPALAPQSYALHDDFSAFKLRAWRQYRHANHLELIDRALEAVERYARTGDAKNGIRNLLIMLPPRHGKSLTVSRLWPAWFLGRNPNMRVLMASYVASVSTQHSRFVRNLTLTQEYKALFPHIRLADDSAAKHLMDIQGYSGGLEAVGKGGAVTGKGANVLLADDLVKGQKEAESASRREDDWSWFVQDYLTRREPNAATIIVNTRWNLDDIPGRLLLQNPDDWHIIKLPALATEDDPLGREPGEALWPERYGRDYLLHERAIMGEYAFSALYQQDPQVAEGGLFKRDRLQIVEHAPATIVRAVRFWDLSMSESDNADPTVGLLLGELQGGGYCVLDVERVNMEWDDVPEFIERVAHRDGKNVIIGIEAAFYLTRAVRKVQRRPGMGNFTIKGFRPDSDKFTRSLPVAARVGEREVFVLRRHWTETFIDELCSFPRGAHDDQVDALSGAYVALDEYMGIAKARKRNLG